MPDISVFMSVCDNKHNKSLEWLDIAVKSTLDQTFYDFEFFIALDGNIGRLADYLLNLSDNRITVIQYPKQGQTINYNNLLRLAEGKYITRVDADDTQDIRRFAKQVEILNRKKDFGACGCWYQMIDQDGKKSKKICSAKPEDITDLAKLAGSLPGSGTMIRADAIRNVGGWGPWEYAQDFALWVKMRKAGWHLYNIPEVLYYYRQHNKQVSTQKKIEQKRCHQEIVEQLCRT